MHWKDDIIIWFVVEISKRRMVLKPFLLDGWLKAPLRIFKTPKIWLNFVLPLRTMVKIPLYTCLGWLKAPLNLETFSKRIWRMVKSPSHVGWLKAPHLGWLKAPEKILVNYSQSRMFLKILTTRIVKNHKRSLLWCLKYTK